ncbi:MAG: cob(I)yrinic acid a,c-diamide adenosyltransferase [Alphaproteobacteria bacterium]|jgi:cob(I)alamin adenosyltransferase|nr:cob(I)yrinic acid a,c-diamide adenosyltransferase [Alphaproteobacteria bacterium]
MVKLNVIYTRTGDDGSTGLVRGPRRAKYDLRVEAYGTVDEANACIGQARLHTTAMPKVDRLLSRIQNDLFDVGSDLATPGADDPAAQYPSLRVRPVQTAALESAIDQHNEALAPLTSFVLPGGSPLAASLHIARTVTRRAERITVELAATEPDTNPEAVRYLNRLSDLLFVLARVANANGTRDVLWVPGGNGDQRKS